MFNILQRMMVGLAAAVVMMLVEMLLFIFRSLRAEQEFENKREGKPPTLPSLRSPNLAVATSTDKSGDPSN